MKTTDSTTLPDDIESLKALVLSLQGESKKYQQLYYETLEKWQLSLKQRFAASSEGYPGQGELFNEAEELLAPSEEEIAADQTITYTRKKTRRPSLAAELPREDVVHDIPEGVVAVGNPCKVVRKITPEDRDKYIHMDWKNRTDC